MIKTLLNTKGNILKNIAFILILTSLLLGLFSRVVAVFRYINFFYYDQVRDAYVYMNMWEGKWPTLGPAASIGNYSLLPLYYYLVFPFTVLGPNPVFQALPNALFSFLSIPLFMWVVYELLENVENSKRFFLVGLAGFWHSLLFIDIVLNTFQWNPSPIPFFLLSFTLLYKYQLEAKLSKVTQVLCWILYGINLAILVSLHSTTMFVMPVVFLASSIVFIFINRRSLSKCLLPVLSILAAVISLFPYWKGELSRGGLNTKNIILNIINSSQESRTHSILDRLNRVVFNYFELGQQAYFIGSSWWYLVLSIIFLSLCIILGIAKFKGNKIIFSFLAFTWLVYFYAASNYWGVQTVHTKMLIFLSPIIFTILGLAYFTTSNIISKILSSFLVLGIILSIYTNITFDYKHFSAKYGQDRVIATSDITYIFNQLPEKSTICNPQGKEWLLYDPYKSYKYIDTYITQKDFKFVDLCQSGNYVLYPKTAVLQSINSLWPSSITTTKNKSFNKDSTQFLETSVAYVYILK